MEKSDGNSHEALQNIDTKRRRTQSKFNKNVPRFQCFCSKQYLSYPALYLHIKNKHNQYLQQTKNGKKGQPTKMMESVDATEGFKIYKLSIDPKNLPDADKKDLYNDTQREMNFQEPLIFQNHGPPYMTYPSMYATQGFNFDYMMAAQRGQAVPEKKVQQKEASIQVALSMFLESIAKKAAKQRKETELLFALLVECLNKHYATLEDHRAEQREVKRYTAEFNCDFLPYILPQFETSFLPALSKEEGKPYHFFLHHSYLMTSEQYKRVLYEFLDFLHDRKPSSGPFDLQQFQRQGEDSSEANKDSNNHENAAENEQNYPDNEPQQPRTQHP